MSTEALAWALRADLTGPLTPQQRLVLATLADAASPDGTGVWLAKDTISHRLGVHRATVHRALQHLESVELIVRGDQRRAEYIPANRRPVVWDVNLGGRVDHTTPALEGDGQPEVDGSPDDDADRGRDPVPDGWGSSGATPAGVAESPSRGSSGVAPGVAPVLPKPRTKPPYKTPPHSPPTATDRRNAPDCHHGTPNGSWTGTTDHPTGWALCPMCRTNTTLEA